MPFSFKGYDVDPETATLPVGDYSIPGFTDRAAIERKSLEDLIGCLMGSNRERFERELAKVRHYDLFVVVVEASLADVSQGRYRSDMKPQAALQSIIASGSIPMTHGLLAKYLIEIEQRFKMAMKGQAQRKQDDSVAA